jgi:hypothetical protein
VRRRKSATQRITEKLFSEFVQLVNYVPLVVPLVSLVVIEREYGAKTLLTETQVHAAWATEQTDDWNWKSRHRSRFSAEGLDNFIR